MKLVQLETNGKCIYTVSYGCWERTDDGPFLGEPNLDFEALIETCREVLYAKANAEKKDYFQLDENNFLEWLIEEGHLTPIENTHIELEVSTSYNNRYVPLHWPLCPRCGEGRGEKTYGHEHRSLNRVDFCFCCTECGNKWGHSEESND